MTENSIHQQLGEIVEAVGTLKSGFDSIITETAALKENSTKLTVIVDQMAPIVAAHESIASSIKKEHLPRLDEHHAYVEMLIRKANFWQSVRDQMLRKGATFFMVCILGAILYWMGFEGVANKIIGQ